MSKILFRSVAFVFCLITMTMAMAVFAPQLASAESRVTSLPAQDFFIRWKKGSTEAQRQEAYKRAGVRPVWRSRLVWGLERVAPQNAALEATSSIPLFRSHPGVMYAEPNYRVHREVAPMQAFMVPPSRLETAPNDPLYSKQWALQNGAGLKIEQAWEVTKGNANVKVAVIDTGVDPTHPEMKGKLAPGYDFIKKTANVIDWHGHGTHVSGIIGANTNNGEGIAGINPNVTIIPIRAVPSQGDETDQDVISAFEFAVQQGARVANCSFGKPEESQAVGDTIAAAGEHGLLAVVAAGNDGVDLNQTPSWPASFHTPNMIVVGATQSRGGLASFSNYGMNKVDVGAPGASIISSVKGGGYATWDGTSMAAPQVTGVAALVLSVKPDLTPVQLKEVILRTAEKSSALDGKVTTGAKVDAAAAVRFTAQLAGQLRR